MARPSKRDVRIRLSDAEMEIVKEAMQRFGESEVAPALRKMMVEWRCWLDVVPAIRPAMEYYVKAWENAKKTA